MSGIDGPGGPVEVVGLDGDDTLWHSESHFESMTGRFAELLAPWVPHTEAAVEHLLDVERRNLRLLGYGVKAFVLSMVETAIEVSGGEVPAAALREVLDWGKELLEHPVELLDGVAGTVEELSERYRLVLVTKGDLLHQESKVARSGLVERFESVEIVSEKDVPTYRRVLDRLGVDPASFVMVGNTVRSDVLPALELGARAVHVPYRVTWAVEEAALDRPVPVLPSLRDLPGLLASWAGADATEEA